MKRMLNIKRVYLFTSISFVATFLYLYAYTKIAEGFSIGWDIQSTVTIFDRVIAVIFMILLLINLIGVLLCLFYTYKLIFNRISRKS